MFERKTQISHKATTYFLLDCDGGGAEQRGAERGHHHPVPRAGTSARENTKVRVKQGSKLYIQNYNYKNFTTGTQIPTPLGLLF